MPRVSGWRKQYGDLLGNQNFRRLWIAQIGLGLGDAVMQMGLLEFFRAHGYAVRVETAKLFLAVSLPGALFGPLAVAYLDKWQRRSVLMLSDAVRALVVVVIGVWMWPVLTGRLEYTGLLFVYAMVFLLGAVTTFHYPARYALLPNLIGSEHLIQANTLVTTSTAVAQIGGRAIGGFVAERVGVEWAVLANVLAYVASLALVWSIRMQPHATTRAGHADPQGGWGELKTGLTYLRRHRTALPLVVLVSVFALLLGILMVAIVGYAMDTLGLGTGGLGYLVAAAGVGAAIGIVAIGRAGRWTQAAWLPVVQLLLIGLLLVALGRTTNPWFAAVLLVPVGGIGATVIIPIDAQLQGQVDDRRRGAVFAARGILTSVAMAVAFWLQFGTAWFRQTRPEIILGWLGAGAMLAAVFTWLTMRRSAPSRDEPGRITC